MEWLLYIFFFLWFGYWSAEAGASLPWSKKWQDFASFGSEIPEIIIALSVGFVAAYCWPLSGYWAGLVFILGAMVAYAGKQSATWGLLSDKWDGYDTDKNNDGKVDFDDYRDNTMTPWIVWIMKKLGFKADSPALAWVWSANKGLLMTLPVGGTGMFTHPIGHYLGVKIFGKMKHKNAYKEFLGGAFCFGFACSVLWGVT